MFQLVRSECICPYIFLDNFDLNLGLSVSLKASLYEIYTKICCYETWENGSRTKAASFWIAELHEDF